ERLLLVLGLSAGKDTHGVLEALAPRAQQVYLTRAHHERSAAPDELAPLASVIVPTLNGAHLLAACLDSLEHQAYPKLEVIVADGASTDGTVALLTSTYPRVRLLRLRHNAGFAGNVNAGLRAARGEVLCLLNNDAQADSDWVGACVETLLDEPALGSVASKVLFADRRTINSAGDLLGRDGAPCQRGAGQPDGSAWNTPGPVFGAMGGAAAYRRAMLADVGLLDEVFFMYLEDVDLAFRAQLRGWGCRYQPLARVYHLGSATGGGQLASFYNGRNLIRLLAKDLPGELVPRVLPGFLRFQARRARAALGAWRGAAARATLRGQLAGLAGLPRHLADRPAIQSRRRVSAEALYALLSPGGA
ncbi:MAG: glycosyltransferase, partial [Actinobacteria bacterium]|nr:glycosyltransferase [Actinomycetota bacterium]